MKKVWPVFALTMVCQFSWGKTYPVALLVTSANLFNHDRGEILSPSPRTTEGNADYYSQALLRYIDSTLPSSSVYGDADLILDADDANATGLKVKVRDYGGISFNVGPKSLLQRLHRLGQLVPFDYAGLVEYEIGRELRFTDERDLSASCLSESGEAGEKCLKTFALPVLKSASKGTDLPKDDKALLDKFSSPLHSVLVQIGSRESIAKLAATYGRADADAGRRLYKSHFHSIPVRLRIYPLDQEHDDTTIVQRVARGESLFRLPDVRGLFLTAHRSSKSGYFHQAAAHAIDGARLVRSLIDGVVPSQGALWENTVPASTEISQFRERRGAFEGAARTALTFSADAKSLLRALVLPAIQAAVPRAHNTELECVVPVDARNHYDSACRTGKTNGQLTQILTGTLPIEENGAPGVHFMVRYGFELFLVVLDKDPETISVPTKQPSVVVRRPAGRGTDFGPLPPPN